MLIAPIIPDPPRDPRLREALFALRGSACSVCGEDTPGWEAEHSRPLGRGGKDALSNMTAMCQPCHRVKSSAERTVWAMSKRWEKRLWIFHARPAPVVCVFLVIFFTGMVTSRWLLPALLVLAGLWWGPVAWRNYRPAFTGRSFSGGGFNRQPDFDRILEERRPGVEGKITRGYWWWRRLFFTLRYVPMALLVTYVAGIAVRSYGLEATVVVVRILSPF